MGGGGGRESGFDESTLYVHVWKHHTKTHQYLQFIRVHKFLNKLKLFWLEENHPLVMVKHDAEQRQFY